MPVEHTRAELAYHLRRVEPVGEGVGDVDAEAHVRVEVLDELVGAEDGRVEVGVAGRGVGAVVVSFIIISYRFSLFFSVSFLESFISSFS